MRKILLAAMIGLWASNSFAHSSLETTIPQNGAIVSKAPSEITLGFDNDIRLTRISMTYADHQSVDLDLAGHDGFISNYTIPLQQVGAGHYIIEWRGLGSDGHTLNGSFDFTVE
ncbi:MAG: copper resistance protein CopC [Litoreibacter sp.]